MVFVRLAILIASIFYLVVFWYIVLGFFFDFAQAQTSSKAHRKMCAEQPYLCPALHTRSHVDKVLSQAGIRRDPVRVTLTSHQRKAVETINQTVNGMIRPVAERSDRWTLSTEFGDCEEYVLLKREALMAIGIPRAALAITVVRTRRGVHHAVLIVQTNSGDLVLDNLTDRIVDKRGMRHTPVAVLESGLWEKTP